MGAENSTPKNSSAAPTLSRAQPTKKKATATRSQYHDIKNPKYADDDLKTMSSLSTESISEESVMKPVGKSMHRKVEKKVEKKVVKKAEKKVERKKKVKEKEKKKKKKIPPKSRKVNPLKALEGLNKKAKVKKSEDMLRKMWKRPHATWDKITDVTKISKEKTRFEAQLSDEVRKRIRYCVVKIIYDVPLERCHLLLPKIRATRSCPDPWRRHGAHVKLCQIGGSLPDSRTKNAKSLPLRKGTAPPADPKVKPLLTVEDYMKLIKK